jgi:hypothetical protein
MIIAVAAALLAITIVIIQLAFGGASPAVRQTTEQPVEQTTPADSLPENS